MNPLVVFDYMFYRLYIYYENNYSHGYTLAAIGLLSIIECVNVLTLLNIIYISLNKSDEIPGSVMLVFGIPLLIILNFFRYNRFVTYQKLQKRWGEEKSKMRSIRGFFMILYFILSVILYVKL